MNERQDTTTARQDTATAPVADQQRLPVERGDVRAADAATSDAARGDVELMPRDRLDDFRGRWERVQVEFVDQPRAAVQQAHDLVDEVVEQLTTSFTDQRNGLEGTWTRGENVSTEDLRLALQRYRTFFNRLLST